MQNVVTVPASATCTSSRVATAHVGHDPRGGMYTFEHCGSVARESGRSASP
jgi:hypothetical protein